MMSMRIPHLYTAMRLGDRWLTSHQGACNGIASVRYLIVLIAIFSGNIATEDLWDFLWFFLR